MSPNFDDAKIDYDGKFISNWCISSKINFFLEFFEKILSYNFPQMGASFFFSSLSSLSAFSVYWTSLWTKTQSKSIITQRKNKANVLDRTSVLLNYLLYGVKKPTFLAGHSEPFWADCSNLLAWEPSQSIGCDLFWGW